MLKNYLKITLAVMKRRKFFTFISLFGICTTLTVLIVLAAFYELVFSGSYPEAYSERTLYSIQVKLMEKSNGYTNSGPMSISFINRFVKSLKTPEKVAFTTEPNTVNTYHGGKKWKLFFKYTDPVFWEIAQFEFLEGQPYTQQQVDNNEAIAVINDATRDDYFGKGVPALGKSIEMNGRSLRIIGVVRGSPLTRMMVSADVYMPYNLQKGDINDPRYHGSYTVMVLAKSRADLPKIKAEYADVVSRIPLVKFPDFTPDTIESRLGSFLETMIIYQFFQNDAGLPVFYLLVLVFALMFMTLPAINLVNINVSRIMERASEIGIRKAFGASIRTMTYQFIVENIIVTVLGGALALVLSAFFIWWFNHSQLIPYADLRIDWSVVVVAFALSLLFGLMSGVYPAWRMSKLPVVEALKG
jgi:putative ABC transport system permease protein